MEPNREYATVKAAAEFLGVSRKRIWELVKAGRLTAVPNELDRREKLIPIDELQSLAPYTRVKKAVA